MQRGWSERMPSVSYVLVYCTSCGAQRKVAPERAYEQRTLCALEWSQLRPLACPLCKSGMKRMPEPGEPGMASIYGQWPISEAAWME